MSLGPTSLGNLLAQRLDTVLGISQSGQVRTGAHPDALRQAQATNRLVPTENQRERGAANRPDAGKADAAGRKDSTVQGRQDPRLASQLQRFITDSRFTPSAPTTLGRTARTILSLLTQHANQPVQGRAPLLQPRQLAQALLQQQGQPVSTPATATARGALALTSSSTSTPSTPTQTTGPTAPSSPLPANVATLARTIGGPTALASVFIQALSQNVQQSGMFYESHLAQLVKGQTTPAQLQQQPQAQAHLQANPNTAEAKQSPTSQNAQQNLQAQQAQQVATTLQQSGIDPSTQQLVRQQLEVLANQLFVWRGEAWPGAAMEWEIQRRQEQEDDSETSENQSDENSAPWQTRLRVDLPRLGEVEARLYIADNSLRMHIRAPESAEQLNLNLQPLIQRLGAQGINIEQLQVARYDD